MIGRLKRTMAILTAAVMVLCSMTGCGSNAGKETDNSSGEKIVIRILENDTAKKTGYLEELLNSFNAEYASEGIVAVDANMEEYTDLATNGPYGYGPDVIFQANDKIMSYAEDKLILPLNLENYECIEQIPECAMDAYKLVLDGKTYYCGIPVNIQEPMLFYREDMLPDDWKEKWDDNDNKVPDFFENWNDLYAYSKYLRDCDTSSKKTEKYGFMQSLYDPYLASQFYLSYGAYIFGLNDDGTYNTEDIGFEAGDAALGLNAMKQFAALMYEGCIDDTITLNRYEKIAGGTYFCTVSTPDTYTLFIDKLTLAYEEEGIGESEAANKAYENLKMIEMPKLLPKDGNLARNADEMQEEDFINIKVMGGVNGYAISSYTKYEDACIKFINFATGSKMISKRVEMLGIAPTRNDVATATGGVADRIFTSLNEGRIYLMPSVKAVDRIWIPAQTVFSEIAKDAFCTDKQSEKYKEISDFQNALNTIDRNIYDAIFTLSD